MSESELQMLASLRRQQSEDLEDTGASRGLSASQVDNCNVSMSTSSDDTTTWNSCLPPVSPGLCVSVDRLAWENQGQPEHTPCEKCSELSLKEPFRCGGIDFS